MASTNFNRHQRFRRNGGNQNAIFKASVRGDSRKVTRLLEQNPQLNVNERDDLGRYPLSLAVKNNHLEVVEQLMPLCEPSLLYDAVLLSISLGHDHITEIILQHENYPGETIQNSTSRRAKSTEEFANDDSLFATDVTPLILAAQRNQFEIVKILLNQNESILEPHVFNCDCKICKEASKDELRFAKTRLSIYKALASPAYISLYYEDPVLRAFELGRKLRKLSVVEKHFSSEYLDLAGHLSDYVTRLLDRVRDGEELNAVLDQGRTLRSQSKLARLKLALRYKEKKISLSTVLMCNNKILCVEFVAHPVCQKKLTSVWYGDLVILSKTRSLTYLLLLLALFLCYPFMAIAFWVYPWGKLADVLRTPVIKFLGAALSYAFFTGMIISYTFTEMATSGNTVSQDSIIGEAYISYNSSRAGDSLVIGDVPVRYHTISYGTIIITVWIIGMVWQSCKKIYHEGLTTFRHNWYNLMDIVMLALYIASFTLRYYSRLMVKASLSHFSKPEAWFMEANGTSGYLYWIDADRHVWNIWDPTLVSDALFAIANVLSLTRFTYVLAVSERMGPLLISLTRIARDVGYFMIVFIVVIVAFVIGFRNLYWYYDTENSIHALNPDTDDENMFNSFENIVLTVYWSIYGMTEYTGVYLSGYDTNIVTVVGHILFAIYNFIIVIILINMLIAMMARSYEIIAADEDIEWKYSRSALYLEYIKRGGTLCVPFNLLPNYKTFIKCCCSKWYKQKKAETSHHKTYVNNAYTYDSRKPSLAETESDVSSEKQQEELKKSAKAELIYQVVIQRVVGRFISQRNKPQAGSGSSKISSPTEIAELQLATVQKDLSNFRYEIISRLRRQEENGEDTQSKVNKVELSVINSRDAILSALDNHFIAQKKKLDELQESADTVHDSIASIVKKTQELTDGTKQDLAKLLEEMTKVCTGVTGLNEDLAGVKVQLEEVGDSVSQMNENVDMLSSRIDDYFSDRPSSRRHAILQRDQFSPMTIESGPLTRLQDTITRSVTASHSVGAQLSYPTSRDSSQQGSQGDLRPVGVSARRIQLQ